MTKKTTMIHVRVTDAEKQDLAMMAERQMTDVSTMMRSLAGRLVSASRKHGSRLVWPPEFDYYPAHCMTAGETRRAMEKKTLENTSVA